jgi:hypothetical protein
VCFPHHIVPCMVPLPPIILPKYAIDEHHSTARPEQEPSRV